MFKNFSGVPLKEYLKLIHGLVVFLILAFCSFVYFHLPDTHPPMSEGNKVSDIAGIHNAEVNRIVQAFTEEDVVKAVKMAKTEGLKISVGGAKHSMGGHSFYEKSIHIDMTGLDEVIGLSSDQTILRVQSGTTWKQVQEFLNPKGLAVIAMQGPNIFTVGGSISVNAHGWDIDRGQVAETIAWLRIVDSKGEVVKCSSTENEELFRLVMGGYGLFGVILDAGIFVTSNKMLTSEMYELDTKNFNWFFENSVLDDTTITLLYADYSISQYDFLDQLTATVYHQREEVSDLPLKEYNQTSRDRLLLNLSRQYEWGKDFRWWFQKAFQENRLDSRNNIMRAPYKRLEYYSKDDVDILQEYFIPRDKFKDFIVGLRLFVQKYKANLLNCTIRVINQSDAVFLNYAKTNSFAVVLYFNVSRSEEGLKKDRELTRELIQTSIELGGTFYLPYLAHYDKEHILQAYPEFADFITLKSQYDPDHLFWNSFAEKYLK